MMMNSRFVKLQAVRLAQSALIYRGAWVTCKTEGLSLSSKSERYWMELRGDAILLYPSRELVHQFRAQFRRRRIPVSRRQLQEILEGKEKHMKPKAYISFVHLLSRRVKQQRVTPILFRDCKKASDFTTRTITFTAYNSCAIWPQKSMFVTFDTYAGMIAWQHEMFQVPEVSQKTLSDFSLVMHIGRGATSDVFLVRDRFSGKKVAMKAIDKEGAFPRHGPLRRIVDERLVNSRMRKHPYILEMSHAFETEKGLYVATEYCSRGDLFHHLRDTNEQLSETKAKKIAAEILLALEALHDQGIMYRDLKPENVMVADNGHVKLADFGAAKITEPYDRVPRAHSSVGTVEYLAPEMVKEERHDRSVDLWAFGIFICELLNGETPYAGENDSMTYANILNSAFIVPGSMSQDAKDLARRLLQRKPGDRLGTGVNGWEEIKAHPWFRDIDWETLLLQPALTGPFGNFYEQENRRNAPKRRLSRTENVRNSKREAEKRAALARFKLELNTDLKRSEEARADYLEGRASDTPLRNERNLKRTFGAYAYVETVTPPLVFEAQELPSQQLVKSNSRDTSIPSRRKETL